MVGGPSAIARLSLFHRRPAPPARSYVRLQAHQLVLAELGPPRRSADRARRRSRARASGRCRARPPCRRARGSRAALTVQVSKLSSSAASHAARPVVPAVRLALEGVADHRVDLDLGVEALESVACGRRRSSARTPRAPSATFGPGVKPQGFSTTVARPCPTPMHIVARPQRAPRRRISQISVVEQARARAAERVAERDRAAVHVQPLAVDPELAACRRAPARRRPRSARRGRCRSTSRPGALERLARRRARARCPCTRGRRRPRRSTRCAPAARGRARCARSSVASTTQAAPSLICEELPAVTVPPSRNTGRSLASFSSVVSGRGPSSACTVTGSPFGCGTGTGTISSSKRPASGGRDRAPVALERELVLVGARDAVALGDVLGRLAHRVGASTAPPCAGSTKRQPIVVS